MKFVIRVYTKICVENLIVIVIAQCNKYVALKSGYRKA
jgi:hypothetical protein